MKNLIVDIFFFFQITDDDNSMVFLKDQQNTESSKLTVDTKDCELETTIPIYITVFLNIKLISHLC